MNFRSEFSAPGRGGATLRRARIQQIQRTAGNRAAQRLVQRLDERSINRKPDDVPARAEEFVRIQRDSQSPAGGLNNVQGDAAAQEAQVSSDAAARASELDSQGSAASAQLQSQAAAQSTALAGEAAVQSGQLGQQSATQGGALQSRAGAQGARLSGDSAAHAAALQQEATSASTHLQGDVGALETTARATEASTQGELVADATGMQGDAEASAGAVQGQWGGLEAQTTARVTSMTGRTQALLDQKAALVKEYESPGTHDPERFQRRWDALQTQIGPLEQEQSNLDRVETSGESISERAGAMWTALTNRGQALLTRVSGVATNAWNAVQGRWTALQGSATAALAGLQSKAGAAVNALRTLATGAWTGLQGAATRAWTGLQGMTTGVWTGLQAGATAAWSALQSQATAAWMALQRVANSVVGNLASKISGIVSRINGAIGRILDAITDAVGSVLARLRRATGSALEFLRARASAAWTSVKNLGTRAWDGLKNVGTRAWQGAKDLGTRAWEGLKSLGTRAWQGLKDLGTRAWNGLKDLGQRAWNRLKSGWDWLKKKAESAWTWLKGAWETLKRKASQAWDWIKRKAKDAIAWLKKKWAWLKALVAKAWAWLKAKWKWLKSLVKIKIRIPDQTLCKLHNFKPWKFVDRHGGRIPIVKTVVDPGIGPVELALFVQANAEATIGGTVGPCTLKNIAFTLQPLLSRYTGQADFHVAASAVETLSLSGTIGGTANYGGLIALLGGGLEGKGSASALGAFEAKPRFIYDTGKVSASVPVSFDFCLVPAIDLGAFVTAKLIAGKPPAITQPTPPAPILPGLLQTGGCFKGANPGVPATQAPAARKPGDEEVLKEWIKRWHLKSWTKKECWHLGAQFQLAAGPGAAPEVDVHFDAEPVSVGDVVRSMFDALPAPDQGPRGGSAGGGKPDPADPGILKDVTASGRCKCVGDENCGGGKIYVVCYSTQKDCKKSQKDLDDFCNNNSDMKQRCTRPKCYYRHSKSCCPDECTPGDIKPLETGPVVPQASCAPVVPAGSPTVNNPGSGNDCTPKIPTPDWDVIEIDANNWGACVAALPLSGIINIKPWTSQPSRLVVPNTANPQDGGNIDNTAGSKNHWKYVIDDMGDYDSAATGGAGVDWHATAASEAHEWAHWNLDFKADSLLSAAGGDWQRTNSDLNSLREPKAASSSPSAAKAALKPRVDARVKAFRDGVVKRWNHLISQTDSPGKGGRGYAAGMAVLNNLIVRVRNYKDQKKW